MRRHSIKIKLKASDETIFQQTERICSSYELRTKKRLCSLFKYIVKESLNNEGNKLKGYTIGVELFNRGKDFNSELDPIVRIEVGRLRRSLDTYYMNEGKNDSILIAIPKGCYTACFTPNEQVELKASEGPKKEFTEKPSIAVLPFKNLTGDPEKNYFAIGFTEEISIELTHYEDFQVIACRTLFESSQEKQIAEKIIEKLGVHYIIEGSLRIDEKQMKISIILIDAQTKKHLWAENYKRELDAGKLISTQEDISQQIIAIICSEYGIIPQKLSRESRSKKPEDFSIYEAMQRYYYYQAQPSPETLQQAFLTLEQASIKDPNCGVVRSMLASLYGDIHLHDLEGNELALEKFVELAQTGVKLDPNNQLVRLIYALSFFVRNKKEQFLIEIEKALKLNPNYPLRVGSIGLFLCLYGEYGRGKELLDNAMKFNVGFPSWYYAATTIYYYKKNNYKKAYEEALKFDVPGMFWVPLLRATCLEQLKNNDAAKKELNDLLALRPDFHTRWKYLISLWVKEKELADHLFEGLQKAGLKIR